MKKIFLMLSLACSMNSFSQDFHHGGGAQLNVGLFKFENANYSETGVITIPGLAYKAVLGFEVSRDRYFAVSAQPFLGFYFNSQIGGFIGYELPILGEFYFGEFDEKHFFVNGGFSYGYLNNGGSGGSVLGPKLGLGGQFEIKDRLITLNAGYTYGINKNASYTLDNRSAISIGLIYPFGVN